MRSLAIAVMVMWGTASLAQVLEAVPEPPPLPAEPTIRDGQPIPASDEEKQAAAAQIDPEVEVTDEGVEEYSVKGRRLGMKIRPQQGPSYYISDPTGDGSMQESSPEDLDGERNITKWRLGGW